MTVLALIAVSDIRDLIAFVAACQSFVMIKKASYTQLKGRRC